MVSIDPYPTDDQRWQAVLARDPQADGRFFYSVKSTGVFCRTTCGARRPLRANVSFHSTTGQARTAGFRPCRRCRPEDKPLMAEWSDAVAKACRIIEEAPVAPSNAALAAAASMSTSHFQRVFKQATGLTPKAYGQQVRAARVREQLRYSGTITDAVYGSGFNSSSRFYAGSSGMLGMTATRYRRGGEGEVIRFGVGECSLGWILVAATEHGVCAILLGDDPQLLTGELEQRFDSAELIGGDDEFERWMAAAITLVDKPSTRSDLPLDIRGTAFQCQVWKALQQIPVGATATYSEVAQRIGRPKAVRAVAAACAANPVAVAVPCHRVVRADHSPSGYRWGVERKLRLLRKEADPD